MIKSFTVIAEGSDVNNYPSMGFTVKLETRDIQFRGIVTNETPTSISVKGIRNIPKRRGNKVIEKSVPVILHFNKKDVVGIRRVSEDHVPGSRCGNAPSLSHSGERLGS